jgi:AcrR family transcriptional regulator
MVSGHMIQERLRAGDLRGACQNEQQREKAAADNRDDSDGHGPLLRPLLDKFALRYQLISENQMIFVTQEKIPLPRLNREESQARTRSLLIEAARNEIVNKGFAQASVRDIADAAGFSQDAFYSNFPDKEAILLELVQRHQSEERAKIEAALSHAHGDPAKTMAGIEKWAATINADPGFAVLAIELQLQALRSPSFAQGYNDLNRKHRRALGVLVTKLFELVGRKLPADPVEIATGFIALGRGMALVSKDGETSRSGRIIVTFLKALIGSAPIETNRK